MSQEKSLDTLVEDIYNLLDFGRTISDEEAQSLGQAVGRIVQKRISEAGNSGRSGCSIRMSSVGRPARQLWYETHYPNLKEDLRSQTKLKFLIGDIWEVVLLHLAEWSGHKVEHKQTEVVLGPVVGHPDCLIDGVVVDIKSASTQSFKKFKYGTLKDDDPFGYIGQLAAYTEAICPGNEGAFLAADKQHGDLALLRISAEDLQAVNIRDKIESLVNVILPSPEPPERCYEPVPEGKSGNMKLPTGCSYCLFKQLCWADANNGQGLRAFAYSSGPVFLTQVEKEPNVPEIPL